MNSPPEGMVHAFQKRKQRKESMQRVQAMGIEDMEAETVWQKNLSPDAQTKRLECLME